MEAGKATAAQIRKIYISAREHGIDDDLLHEHIFRIVKKGSIKLLTKEEAAKVIDSLEGRQASGKDPMTQKQRFYILSLAKKLGWTDEAGRVDEKRLNGMCEKYAKTGCYKWLSKNGASGMIEALKNMSAKTEAAKKA